VVAVEQVIQLKAVVVLAVEEMELNIQVLRLQQRQGQQTLAAVVAVAVVEVLNQV
tara:strand:- start:128 stop:292 length:165 start_codon:yes stop_codon:yes gene_type:complete